MAACILLDIPGPLRLAVFIVCLLMAYATGTLWAMSAGYQADVARTQAQGELVEVRMHVRQLWGAYEALRTRQDRQELQSPRAGDGLTPAEEREGGEAAQTEAASDAQGAPGQELLTVPATTRSPEPSRTIDW